VRTPAVTEGCTFGVAKQRQQWVASVGFAAPQEAQAGFSSAFTKEVSAGEGGRLSRPRRCSSLLAVMNEEPTLPTAEDLGLMAGTPPPPERLVTLDNWITPPFNRWGLQHLQELVPCAPIPGAPTPWRLPRTDRDLGTLRVEVDGRIGTLDDVLDETATDAFIVLQRGTILWERYANGMGPATRHLCFSVSKSVVATVAGILIGRGELDPSAFVTELIEELAGTAWEGATVQHLLDMRTGTAFSEVYDEVGGDSDTFGQVIGWFPRTDPSTPADTYTYLAGMPADRPHGGSFDYRTPLTSMVGWVCERVADRRMPALIGDELWTPMGAEFEASLAVDAIGSGFVGGGFNATLRDMARFGELWRRGGALPNGTQLISADWVRDTLSGGPDSTKAWWEAPQFKPDPMFPDAFYRNKWWIHDATRPLYSAIGIHGQYVTIDGAAELVVARFSSLPVADDEADDQRHIAVVGALGEALTG
jgi:CubicO group peptidase (beta-lactamase class C family)